MPPDDIKAARLEAHSDQNHALPRDGAVYLLRSISPRHSDTLVAFRVEKILPDHGVVIVWRLLANWETSKH